MKFVQKWETFAIVLIPQYFLVTLVHSAELPLQARISYKLVSGLLMERVPAPSSHFYKEYVPLVYQFTIPRWSKQEMMIYGSQNCSTTNYTKFFTTCPILYYLNELHDRFTEFITHNQPLVANLIEINAKPEGSQISLDCELVRSHFEDIYVDKVILDEYLARLKSCSPLGSQEFVQGISNYVYNISGLYLQMRRNFYNEYWLKIDLLEGRVDAAIWANAINIFNAFLFENHLMESHRWKAAIVDCEAGRIPSTILPPSLLIDTLSDMVESLVNQGSIPTVSTSTVGNYYKASLTDCTFTNDTFLVRILIPVVPNTEKYLLVKVTPTPFYYKDKTTQEAFQCEVDSTVLPTSSNAGEDTYALVDVVQSIAYESDCKPAQLCHIPTALHPRKVSRCVTAVFNWERFKGKGDVQQDLIKYCPVKCSSVDKFKKDSLVHVTPFQFLWFSGDDSNKAGVGINCSTSSSLSPATTGANYLVYQAKSRGFGAQEFEINCNCHISHNTNIHKPKPCDAIIKPRIQDTVQITQVAPIQWYSSAAQKQIKEFWNVPENIFNRPTEELIWKSGPNLNIIGGSLPSSKSQVTTAFLSLITILCFGLAFMVMALAYRLRALIVQLERSGLNVRGTYNISNPIDSTNQQVSYRNMSSTTDTDNLLFNEGNY